MAFLCEAGKNCMIASHAVSREFRHSFTVPAAIKMQNGETQRMQPCNKDNSKFLVQLIKQFSPFCPVMLAQTVKRRTYSPGM